MIFRGFKALLTITPYDPFATFSVPSKNNLGILPENLIPNSNKNPPSADSPIDDRP
jgi:hypothetical protein